MSFVTDMAILLVFCLLTGDIFPDGNMMADRHCLVQRSRATVSDLVTSSANLTLTKTLKIERVSGKSYAE
jgi:hypothetical protein